MKQNIVLRLVAAAALATNVLVLTPAEAGNLNLNLQRGGSAIDAERSASVTLVRSGGRPGMGPGFRAGRPGPGPRVGSFRPRPGHFGPARGYYRGPSRGYYYGGPRGYYYGYGPRYYYDDGFSSVLGVLGGLAIGGAIANSYHYSRPGGDCYFEKRRVRLKSGGWRTRNVEVCY